MLHGYGSQDSFIDDEESDRDNDCDVNSPFSCRQRCRKRSSCGLASNDVSSSASSHDKFPDREMPEHCPVPALQAVRSKRRRLRQQHVLPNSDDEDCRPQMSADDTAQQSTQLLQHREDGWGDTSAWNKVEEEEQKAGDDEPHRLQCEGCGKQQRKDNISANVQHSMAPCSACATQLQRKNVHVKALDRQVCNMCCVLCDVYHVCKLNV